MQILLNGEIFETQEAYTLIDLLSKLQLANHRVAVLINDEVIRKARHAEVRLTPGSKIDIIQMVGGG